MTTPKARFEQLILDVDHFENKPLRLFCCSPFHLRNVLMKSRRTFIEEQFYQSSFKIPAIHNFANVSCKVTDDLKPCNSSFRLKIFANYRIIC